MIRYALCCDRDHQFEAWFSSGAAYDRAAKAGANSCPVCGSANIEKAIMAPAIAGAAARAPAPASETVTLATVDPHQQAFQAAVREFRKKVTENADYVGDRFAEEARKIHFGEAPARVVYGEATQEEAEALAEDGVAFQPLPPLPEGQN
jgi:hypothetical protein